MARPTKAKDPKPKAESGASGSGGIPGGFIGFIIMNATLTIVICAIFVGAVYFMMNTLTNKLLPEEDTHENNSHGESNAYMTFPYELNDFIINLNSPNERRYLKVKISLDVERQEGEPVIGMPASGGSGHGGVATIYEGRVVHTGQGGSAGHGSGGGPKGPTPAEYYNAVMEPFKMPIRDIIITQLSSMSAEELSSTPGKERAKDAIKEEINTIMPEERQVIRVNFGEFIIQ